MEDGEMGYKVYCVMPYEQVRPLINYEFKSMEALQAEFDNFQKAPFYEGKTFEEVTYDELENISKATYEKEQTQAEKEGRDVYLPPSVIAAMGVEEEKSSPVDMSKRGVESLTKTGKTEWSKTIIQGMLSNERYTGDMLLQKTYTENCITKKVLKNRGEMAKYLITNNHPAIIDRDTFKAAQKEIARRSGKRKTSEKGLTEQSKYSGKYALTELLVCGECGSPYRRRTWMRNGVSRKVWRCLSRVENGTTCCKDSITVEEDLLQQTVCRALRKAIQFDREAYDLILSNLSYGVTGIDDSLDIFAIDTQIKELKNRIEENVELAMNTEGDPQKYYDVIKYMNSQILALNEQLNLAKEKLSSEEKIGLEIARTKECLTDMTIFDKYDDRTIRRLVEHIRVMGDKRLIIVLKGGLIIEESLRWDL